jgi:hypothetical protein
MSPIIIMDRFSVGAAEHRYTQSLKYRAPDDHISFWTGKYPSAGEVRAFMCANCGHIALYGSAADASTGEPGSD